MHAVLQQKNKTFEPHLLVVTKGSTVDFPNRDPWFHNVFSLFNGKRFDLGLYEAGTSRTVHFDREGISLHLLQHSSRDERRGRRTRQPVLRSSR